MIVDLSEWTGDGWRVWVTRDEGPEGPLSKALRAVGREPVVEPVTEVCTLIAADDLVVPLTDLRREDWLVLTSARAVATLPRIGTRARVAVAGRGTREAAEALGLNVSLESPDGTAAGAWIAVDRRAGRVRILYPRDERAVVPKLKGLEIIAPAVYGTRPRAFDPSVAARIDAASFASPTAANAVAFVLRTRRLVTLSMGPATSDALLALGVRDVREATAPTFAGLARTH